MRRRQTPLLVALALLSAGVAYVGAQFVVSDPWTTGQDTTIAIFKDLLLQVLTNESDQLRQMAKRLSAWTSLIPFWLPDAPAWRIHVFFGDQFLYANPYTAALNYGDPGGTAYEGVARDRQQPGAELTALAASAPDAYAAVVSALATLDLADSTIIAGTDQTGQLRFNGRQESDAIDALDADVIDPSSDQSATAVLDKISGAELLAARQRQARLQFLTAMVEQLLVDNKRDRDTEAAVMNMQFGRLRSGSAGSQSLIAGAADDLRAWRQP